VLAGVSGVPGGGASGEASLPGLVEALRAWRLAEARRSRIPAFRVLTDRTLVALATARPEDEEGLLAVPGIGPTLARKYGSKLLAILRGTAF
jgi:DNA topoisomerase III